MSLPDARSLTVLPGPYRAKQAVDIVLRECGPASSAISTALSPLRRPMPFGYPSILNLRSGPKYVGVSTNWRGLKAIQAKRS